LIQAKEDFGSKTKRVSLGIADAGLRSV